MNNKQAIITATSCVLAYAGLEKEIDTYTSILNHLLAHFDFTNAKSIRYENDRRLLGSVQTPNSTTVEITCPTTEGDLAVTVVEYFVREEATPRYAFFSDKFTKAFSLRFFVKPGAIERFSKHRWIDTMELFDFWNSKILSYSTEGSKVARYGVYFDEQDMHKSFEDFKEEVGEYISAGEGAEATEATYYFG